MDISVFGTKNKKLIAELCEASEFFAHCLMDRRMVNNLELDIELDSKLDVQGTAINEDGTRRSRYFTIQLRNGRGDDLIQTLAHEMVHVKQHAKNELVKDYGTARGGYKLESVWMGKVWRPKSGEDLYFDSPWEVEAYGREVGLMHRWIKHKENSK
jgi:hypothetical protein